MLSLLRARVQSLVRELRFYKPCGMAKKKKIIINKYIIIIIIRVQSLSPYSERDSKLINLWWVQDIPRGF